MKEVLLKNYKKPDYQIPEVELYVDIKDDFVNVKSKLNVKLDGENSNAPLVLNGRDLKVISIKIDGDKIEDYKYEDNLLTIDSVPNNFVFEAEVEIDPYNNKSMEGFYKSGDILCTQNESEGFRRITFFTDRPDVMSKFTITLEGDKSKYPKLLGNGNLIESKDLGDNRYSNKWEDPFEKPCYLVAMVAGELDVIEDSFTTMSNRNIKLEIYTDPGKSSQAYHAMESLKKSMKWDEETFGLEYDLDLYMVVAVDSFNAGAMENKGLNIFNSVYVLADPESATDTDFEGIEGVIGHEYFHNWTGNRVTCRDWFQLTLKEGLTVFRDQEFSSDMTDRDVKRIEDVSVLRTHQFAEDKGPNSHPIKPASYMSIDNFYTLTVYEKGAEVIRMIHTLIGKENFRKGMDLYFKRHTGQAVTTEDFVSAMADASGSDLEQFKLWYSQAGTPVVDVDSDYKDGVFTLKIRQSLPDTSYNGGKEPMYFPFNLGLYSKSGKDLTPESGKQLIISKEYEEFTFNVSEEVVPSLLQGFSAPVIVNYDYTIEDLITLLKFDADLFNKFDAARRLTMFNINELLSGNSVNSEIIEAYKNLLTDKTIDKRFMAKLLYIPEVRDIAATMDEYDYVKANKVRKEYIISIATELKSIWKGFFKINILNN